MNNLAIAQLKNIPAYIKLSEDEKEQCIEKICSSKLLGTLNSKAAAGLSIQKTLDDILKAETSAANIGSQGDATPYTLVVQKQPSCGIFVDRVSEITKMATHYLKVIAIGNLSSGERNNYAPPILATSQMWGSGKTHLGNNFIRKLKDSATIREAALEKYVDVINGQNPRVNIQKLMSLQTVYIDMRNITINQENGDISAIWMAALCHFLIQTGIPICRKPNPTPCEHTPKGVLNSIAQCFIHIDEIDHIFANNQDRTNSMSIVYYLWTNLFQDLALNGYPVYISGRSSVLLTINQHLFGPRLESPVSSKIFQILLDMFSIEHIKEYVSQRLKITEIPQKLINEIFEVR
ncbi:hypothetical protein SAMD00019534_049230 [Acytostelium subglobosum LB1]|uniref:hypothetical protein n=1 Tax=Acytostelium subglobosum LB1 TaxID=1410327 RepID=UPI000644AB74|nr:hypothetical protein SAMD00019534_049230 [Acytostelium subglobosum LB1]GAM21748.1 hypothetical protein SAMD00019534_049230 [Acytostelium subglobosum LB1]|eukprot:XP_012754848.1 hypothetical protein SAMD00019534_049230 [Acytostelium subglobosum LB1]